MNLNPPPQGTDRNAGCRPEDDGADAAHAAWTEPGWTEAHWSQSRWTKRRIVTALLAVAALLALVSWLLILRANSTRPTTAASGPPVVSVLIPGLSAISEQVEATGTIHARSNIPIGVVGEGGMVSRILVQAGQSVKAGQILAEMDASVQRAQLQQLQAAVAQAEADACLAQSELDRAASLVERGFISKADIERRTATRDSARARVAITQAQVREMQARIERLVIRAPADGLVLARRIDRGQVLSPSSGTVYQLAAGGRFEVKAQIAEQDMPRIHVGQTATITPVGSTTQIAGTIWLIEPAINPDTRLGTARIELAAREGVHVGGFANVLIEGDRQQRPLVPQSAVQVDDQGNYVLVVDADDIVRRQPVTIGEVSSAGMAISTGLSGTERVVTVAAPFLHVGEKVKPAPTSRPGND